MARIIPKPSATGGGAGLSNAVPQPLGSASAGTSTEASRADHIHAAPNLNDLQDVSLTSPNNGDALVYSSGTSQWVSAQISGVEPFIIMAQGII